ncbi:hypothetical protein Pmar_PMAR022240, partial [Perkinsus marinus ATCC 50983]
FRWVMGLIILIFAKSCMEQFAQQYQKEIDDARLIQKYGYLPTPKKANNNNDMDSSSSPTVAAGHRH